MADYGSATGERQRRRKETSVNEADIKRLLDARISRERAKELLIALVKVPSPQTELLEDEPLLRAFIRDTIGPRLRDMGFADIRYDAMGNLIATHGAGTSGKSLMLIGNAMNQPAATMPNPYDGDVVDGAKYGLPGECVMGKGASEQKANLAGMLHALETVIASKVPLIGRLIFTCCLSGETGKHDAIKSVVEGAGVRADMAVLGGTGLKVTLGNRGRIDVFVTVKGAPCHSSRPWDGINAITGASECIRRLLANVKVDASHPELGRQSLTVNHIRSFPDSAHTVQERCELTLDRRLLPGEDPNAAFAEIERVAKEVEAVADPVSGRTFSIDVRLGPFMYPSLVTADTPVVRAIMRASEVMLGAPAETYYSPAAFDQGYLNHVGIITANYGAGENQYAHTDQDMASVERTTDSAKVYAFMILDYLT
jgi:acetylornithine deacetylase/succinyl-diaminopimelate desuccinylase-like protein